MTTLTGTTRPRRVLLQLCLLWAAVRTAASSAGAAVVVVVVVAVLMMIKMALMTTMMTMINSFIMMGIDCERSVVTHAFVQVNEQLDAVHFGKEGGGASARVDARQVRDA